jgi:hypothetical protein
MAPEVKRKSLKSKEHRNINMNININKIKTKHKQIKFFVVNHSSSLLLPYPSPFSFWVCPSLPGEDLDVISIPFQIY